MQLREHDHFGFDRDGEQDADEGLVVDKENLTKAGADPVEIVATAAAVAVAAAVGGRDGVGGVGVVDVVGSGQGEVVMGQIAVLHCSWDEAAVSGSGYVPLGIENMASPM